MQVTITDATPGATIYYTTNGYMPSTSSTLYTGPVTLVVPNDICLCNSANLLAIAVAPNHGPSAVGGGLYNYVPGVAEPLISPPGGTYTSSQTVMITDATPGAVILYTTDGTTPSRTSPMYTNTNPISVTSTEVIKALAFVPGYLTSPEGAAKYTIIPPNAATPALSRPSGDFTGPQTVSISVFATVLSSLRWAIFAPAKIPARQLAENFRQSATIEIETKGPVAIAAGPFVFATQLLSI